MSSSLKEYVVKRNFSKTSEPSRKKPAVVRPPEKPLFVIQKHAARRLHYDFRLAMDDVLKSWAVPKGLPVKKGQKALAMHVEDHPMDYAHFEGTIPQGEYGGGTVMVWDTGTYEVDGNPIEGLRKGKLSVRLEGKKLKGEWHLIRMRNDDPGDKDAWLIIKSEKSIPSISSELEDQSVLTKRSMEQITNDQSSRVWSSRTPEDEPAKKALRVKKNVEPREKATITATSFPDLKGAPRGKAAFLHPMKARLVDQLPTDDSWIYEIKFDGYRALGIKNDRNVALWSRGQIDVTEKYGIISEALHELRCKSAMIDGEIVALDEKGLSSFQLLQKYALENRRATICYYVFDILNLDGRDLRALPLVRRKEILQKILPDKSTIIRFSANLPGPATELESKMKKVGLEGIIAKQRDSLYESDQRSGAWVKFKFQNEQEFVIGGYTPPKGSRPYFGALLVGYYENNRLRFASKVGTGFDHKLLKGLYHRFQSKVVPECPFVELPRKGRWNSGLSATEMKQCNWMQPVLVCQIRFTEWTGDGALRHPVFVGLREDKKATEVVRERP